MDQPPRDTAQWRMRSHRPSPALIIAVAALVVALCGTTVAGYAAGKASGDSVIKKKSLSGNRLKLDSVQGKQVAEATLGKVPSAGQADTATTATTATTADHATTAEQTPGGALVPLSGYNTGWGTDLALDHRVTGVRKDASGYVHLQGAVARTSGTASLIVQLPVGYRPNDDAYFPTHMAGGMIGSVYVTATGQLYFFGGNASFISLEGISFHADQ